MFFTKENNLFKNDLNKKQIQKKVSVDDEQKSLKIFKDNLLLFTDK